MYSQLPNVIKTTPLPHNPQVRLQFFWIHELVLQLPIVLWNTHLAEEISSIHDGFPKIYIKRKMITRKELKVLF